MKLYYETVQVGDSVTPITVLCVYESASEIRCPANQVLRTTAVIWFGEQYVQDAEKRRTPIRADVLTAELETAYQRAKARYDILVNIREQLDKCGWRGQWRNSDLPEFLISAEELMNRLLRRLNDDNGMSEEQPVQGADDLPF